MSALPTISGPGGDLFELIAAALESRGYIILPGVLPAELIDSLFGYFKRLGERDFKKAGIGRNLDHRINRFVRTDRIAWLEKDAVATQPYLDWMESLRLALNERLFLGLFDYECHYAHYPRGAFYKKHLDAFKGGVNRIISTVLYLNPNWMPADGGELLLYSPDDGRLLERVEPRYGRLVLFLSDRFPHEVLTVNKPRHSISGWFRVNSRNRLIPG